VTVTQDRYDQPKAKHHNRVCVGVCVCVGGVREGSVSAEEAQTAHTLPLAGSVIRAQGGVLG